MTLIKPEEHKLVQWLIAVVYMLPVVLIFVFAMSLIGSVAGNVQEDTSKISGAASAISLAMVNLCFGFSRGFYKPEDQHRRDRPLLAGTLFLGAMAFLILLTTERYALHRHHATLRWAFGGWIAELIRGLTLLDVGLYSWAACLLGIFASLNLCASLAAYHWGLEDQPLVRPYVSMFLASLRGKVGKTDERDERVDADSTKKGGDGPGECGEPLKTGEDAGHQG